MATVAKKNALLVIFDYSYPENAKTTTLKDLTDKPMQPVNSRYLESWLNETGWELIEKTDLSLEYAQWYQEFLKKLDENKDSILREFTQEAYDKVYSTFSVILADIMKTELGGSVFYARKI